jgi:hypothetical protein
MPTLIEKKYFMPVRIQRKRVKGWKMPENTVSVTRPGKWGNPFKVGDIVKIGKGGDGFIWLKALNEKYADSTYIIIRDVNHCIEVYKQFLQVYPPKDIKELAGKNLACFCKEGEPCHADILLELANK